jgi:hypothetical protein
VSRYPLQSELPRFWLRKLQRLRPLPHSRRHPQPGADAEPHLSAAEVLRTRIRSTRKPIPQRSREANNFSA